jgi:hypothetical protein
MGGVAGEGRRRVRGRIRQALGRLRDGDSRRSAAHSGVHRVPVQLPPPAVQGSSSGVLHGAEQLGCGDEQQVDLQPDGSLRCQAGCSSPSELCFTHLGRSGTSEAIEDLSSPHLRVTYESAPSGRRERDCSIELYDPSACCRKYFVGNNPQPSFPQRPRR